MTTKPRTVFVTGASTGFGAAIARRFAGEGARVVASARRADKLADLAGEFGSGVHALELDATYPYPGGNVYGGTKAFVRQFTLNLRSDLHGTGVRASCIEPGMVSGTEFSVVRFGGDQEKADAVYQGMEALTSDDIAEAVYCAASLPPHVNVNTAWEVVPRWIGISWHPAILPLGT